MPYRLFVYFLILASAFLLQVRLDAVWGMKINFVLAALITISFHADFMETLIFILFGIFLLNWQPAWSLEMAVFAALPLIFFFVKNIFPWKNWLSAPLAITLGAFSVYLLFGMNLFIAQPAIFLADLAGELVFGLLALAIFNKTVLSAG